MPERTYHQTNTTIYDDERLVMAVHQLDSSGAIIESVDLRFNDFILNTVTENERERYQSLEASDENKLFVFGSSHIVFGFSGVLGDTRLDNLIELDGDTWTGNSYKEFIEFVENHANIGACAEKQRVVSLYYANRLLYGAITDITSDITANQPHLITASFQFYVVSQEELSENVSANS
jgi:hypothetical protein